MQSCWHQPAAPTRAFNFAAGEISPPLSALFGKIWTGTDVPSYWKDAIIVSLHRKGDKGVCSKYRGKTFLNIACKLLEIGMRKRIEPAYAPPTCKNQAGFKRSVVCRDQIFSHRQFHEQRIQFDRLTSVVFADFRVAFDNVNHHCNWKIAASLGLPNKVIFMLHAESRSQIWVTSRSFDIKTGVCERSIWAPLLFNLVIYHNMISALRTGKFGVSLDDSAVADLD